MPTQQINLVPRTHARLHEWSVQDSGEICIRNLFFNGCADIIWVTFRKFYTFEMEKMVKGDEIMNFKARMQLHVCNCPDYSINSSVDEYRAKSNIRMTP